jgi:phage N-6-adenine-methyltransferase
MRLVTGNATTFLSTDSDAIKIGALYARSASGMADAVKAIHECGAELTKKKTTMAHGEWLPWLAEQRDVLGFDKRTAQKLIGFANTTLASHLTPAEALKLSRQVWGHTNHLANGTGENEWYTPPLYIDAAVAVMGAIDLDPASSLLAQRSINAAEFYDAEVDGLTQRWHGRVWLNPPYATELIPKFVAKLVDSYRRDEVEAAIMLTHAYTDTAWFHLAESAAERICWTRGRIGFVSPSGKIAAPTQGQAFFYFGDDADKFSAQFAPFGFVR